MYADDLYGEDSFGGDFYGSWISRVAEKGKRLAEKIPAGYSISTPKGVLTTSKGGLAFTRDQQGGGGVLPVGFVEKIKQYWYIPAGVIALMILLKRK